MRKGERMERDTGREKEGRDWVRDKKIEGREKRKVEESSERRMTGQ